MLKISQSVKGYLVTLIETWTHLILLLANVDTAELSQGLCGLKHQPTIQMEEKMITLL